jgi:hypothetical protein
MWQLPSKDSTCASVESILYSEDITMKRLTHILGRWGVLPLLGLALLVPPQPAEARVDVNVGLGVPAPVVVAPAPIVVHRDTTITGITATRIKATILGAMTALTATITGDTTLGATTATRIGTGATISIPGTPGKAETRTGI